MSNPRGGDHTLVSEFANDPDMLELVEAFVSELPLKVEAFERTLTSNDLDTLAKLAHQLKGSAGGYGFPTITEAASRVERDCKSHQTLDQINQQVHDLITLCRQARASEG